MSRLRIVRSFTLILLVLSWSPASAIDLSQYQGYLQPQSEAAKPAKPSKAATKSPKAVEPRKSTVVEPKKETKDFWFDADASYKNTDNAKLVTLPALKKKTDSFSMPADTRFPTALTPLLTEKKNPRQGVSLSGNTGSLLIPSPGVLEPGKTAVAVHARTFDLYNFNDVRYDDNAYFDTMVGVSYGVMEGLEVGVDKTFTNQDRFQLAESAYVNAKYQVPGNITVGGNFSLSSNAYNSVWAVTGVPVIWVGAGYNFGPGNFRFSYKGYDYLKRAKYGGYNYDYNSSEGYADPVFFMVGGAVPIAPSAHLVYDFNGDIFSLGIRLNYQKTVYIDASYVSDGKYESMPMAISHKKPQSFIFGGSLVF